MNKEEFISLIPKVIGGNESLNALATASADILSKQYAGIDLEAIYGKIDELPEDLLDILAKDFKVDWWSQRMSVEDKRNTLKSSWFVHRKLGTKGAVKRAIAAVYEVSEVKEWFEYGGDPYHFKIILDSSYSDSDVEKYNTIINNLTFYKNVRSYLDGVEYGNIAVVLTQYSDAFPSAYSFKASCKTLNHGN